MATVYVECGWADPKATSEAMKAVPAVGMAQAVANSSNNHLCTGIVGHVPLLPVCGFGFKKCPVPPSSTELAETWRPYMLHCIECFGVERCMFASNFPVDKVSCSYTALFNSFKIIVKDFSVEDKKKLFHDNAVRIYRLQIPHQVQTRPGICAYTIVLAA